MGVVARLLIAIGAVAGAVPTGAAAVPPAPDQFRVHKVEPRAIQLRWRDRAGAETHYQARVARPGQPATIVALPADATVFTSTGLIPGTLYEHRVRACDAGGCSTWSAPRTQATLLRKFRAPYPSLGECGLFPGPPPGISPTARALADQRAWHQDISKAPLHPASGELIDRINANGDQLHPDFGADPSYGIPYVVVPGVQPDVPVAIGPDGWPDQSDFGPAPIPPLAPIEAGSDDHVLVVDRDECELFELYRGRYLGGVTNGWEADSTAYFDLTSTALRPEGWTSADAAGLSILAGLVRYDEVATNSIDHAIRITFDQTRRAYIHPATHYASPHCDPHLPPMGMRLRLRGAYPTAGLGPQSQAIVAAMKRYGVIVADNGGNWFFTGTNDHRWDDDDLEGLKGISGSDFRVVRSAAPVTSPC